MPSRTCSASSLDVRKVPQADILPRAGRALELPTDLGSLLDEGLPSSVTTFRNTESTIGALLLSASGRNQKIGSGV